MVLFLNSLEVSPRIGMFSTLSFVLYRAWLSAGFLEKCGIWKRSVLASYTRWRLWKKTRRGGFLSTARSDITVLCCWSSGLLLNMGGAARKNHDLRIWTHWRVPWRVLQKLTILSIHQQNISFYHWFNSFMSEISASAYNTIV